MKIKKYYLIICLYFGTSGLALAQSVDYSVPSVPEEKGLNLVKITTDNDCVCMPKVKRSSTSLNWLTNKLVSVSPDGQKLAFLCYRNETSNIFYKNLDKSSGTIQRTNRRAIVDFTFSPDGKSICFAEQQGKFTQIYLTDAASGYVCRQVTSGANDYSPIYNPSMSEILFSRQEGTGLNIWSYNTKEKYLSSHAAGINPLPLKDGDSYLCARENADRRYEIWRVNPSQGIEECILTDRNRSFTTPTVSPDGKLILVVGESILQNGNVQYRNTDLYVCAPDGSDLRQLTYHAADDLSPAWSVDGNYIYFISQRGSATGTANIWRMDFK